MEDDYKARLTTMKQEYEERISEYKTRVTDLKEKKSKAE